MPIASVPYTVSSPTLSWGTATDWDNAVSETGVVHENVANTDHSDASTVKKGYPIANPLLPTNLIGFWPFHEDSGTTSFDFGGNNDGTVSGATVNVTGLLGTTGYSFDQTDDNVDTGNTYSFSPPFSIGVWVNLDTADTNDQVVASTELNFGGWALEYDGNTTQDWAFAVRDTGGDYATASSSSAPTTGSWEFIVGVMDNSDVYLYDNAVQNGPVAHNGLDTSTGTLHIGESPQYSQFFGGDITTVMLFDTALSSSEVQTLYDVVDAESSLTSATKSFASPGQPDISDLSYNLNGQSITLDIIGSPSGTSETVSQTLDGSTSYTLTWSSSHTDFRVKPRLSTTDPTVTPTFSSVELQV